MRPNKTERDRIERIQELRRLGELMGFPSSKDIYPEAGFYQTLDPGHS